jgi:hypothetical protein
MKLLTLLGFASLSVGAIASPVAHISFVRGHARYHAIVVDLSAGKLAVKTVLANGSHSAWSMIGKDQPIAAITGTFFSPGCSIPVADVLVDGDLKAKGDRGSCMGVDYCGAVSIFDEHFRTPVEWSAYQYGLRGAVRVVSNGRVCPDPKSQRFHDRAIWGSASRTGIGLTKAGKLVLIGTSRPVTLSEFGRAMLQCGIRNGISLDGGSSTCLYYNGKMLLSPRRQLTNLLLITPRPAQSLAMRQIPSKLPPPDAGNVVVGTGNSITIVRTQQNAVPPSDDPQPATPPAGTGGKQR